MAPRPLFTLIITVLITLVSASIGNTMEVRQVDTTKVWKQPQQPEKSFGHVLADIPKTIISTPVYIVEGIAWLGIETVYSSEFLYEIARTLISPVPYQGFVPVGGYGSNIGLELGGKLGYRNVFVHQDYMRTIATYSTHHYQRYGFKYDSPFLYGDRGGARFTIDYRNEPYESFYGLGNSTSGGDEVAYTLESTRLGLDHTIRLSSWMEGHLGIGYSITNVFNGQNDDHLNSLDGIRERFELSREQTDVARFVTFKAGLVHDWRNHPGQPSAGGVERIALRYHQGTGRTSDLRYSELELDAWHFLNLHRQRILALRALVRLQDKPGDAAPLPFYLIDGLGGEDALRGYRTDRFVASDLTLATAEYRWPIWDVFDAFLFYDIGRVYNDIGNDFTWENWHPAYGFGLRLWGDDGTRLKVTTAFSDETTRFYLQVGEEF